MAKIAFPKPGNFVYPVPAVIVSCRGKDGKSNLITIAWTGTVCSDPPMAYISVRKERASYDLIKESGEFVINLPGSSMAKAVDYCGCTSLRKVDKWKECGLHEGKSTMISAPTVEEAPVSIECKVTQILPLGSHDMFLAEVVAVQIDDKYMDEKGSFHMEDVDLLTYSHGEYYALGELLGNFGYSVRKNDRKKLSTLKKKTDFRDKTNYKKKTDSNDKANPKKKTDFNDKGNPKRKIDSNNKANSKKMDFKKKPGVEKNTNMKRTSR